MIHENDRKREEIFDLTARLMKESFSLSALKGKCVLMENVASVRNNNQGRYSLEQAVCRHSTKGLVTLGVPCN